MVYAAAVNGLGSLVAGNLQAIVGTLLSVGFFTFLLSLYRARAEKDSVIANTASVTFTSLRQANEDLRTDITRLQQENTNMRQALQQERAEKESLYDRVDKLEDELAAARTKMREAEYSWNARIRQMTAQLDSMARELHSIRLSRPDNTSP